MTIKETAMAFDVDHASREEVEAYVRTGMERERRRAKTKKSILLVAGALAAVGGVWRCSEVAKEHVESSAQAKAAAEAAKPTVRAFAPDLLAEFDANELAAEKKFHGANVASGGVVVDIKSGVIAPRLDLFAGPGPTVIAYLQASEKDKAAGLQKGNSVSLLCDGAAKTIGRVHLDRCTIREILK